MRSIKEDTVFGVKLQQESSSLWPNPQISSISWCYKSTGAAIETLECGRLSLPENKGVHYKENRRRLHLGASSIVINRRPPFGFTPIKLPQGMWFRVIEIAVGTPDTSRIARNSNSLHLLETQISVIRHSCKYEGIYFHQGNWNGVDKVLTYPHS